MKGWKMIKLLKNQHRDLNLMIIAVIGFLEFSFVQYVLLKDHFITGERAMNNLYWLGGILWIIMICGSKESKFQKIGGSLLTVVLVYLLTNYL